MILVITRNRDAHGVRMAGLLQSIGEEVSILDYSQFPVNIEITSSFLGVKENTSIILNEGTVVSSGKIKSVLNRRQDEPKPPEGIRDDRIKDYIVRESRNLLDTLPQILNCFWLNNPDANKIASRKPYQLAIARRLGFSTPPTLITNSPTEAEKFLLDSNSDIAVKSLWTPGITIREGVEEKGISFFTRRFRPEEALGMLQNIKNCPIILQSYIEKAFELRITVVGDRVFSCAIHSQQSERTKEDWRRYDLGNTPHKEYDLPREIEDKCILLAMSLNLSFGCIDVVVTPSGEYFFLEINPNGQWLWIEHLTGMPISKCIADLLKNPPN